MIIIGEKINSTLKAVRPAIENYDAEVIKNLAKAQTDAGATYIDVNAGMFLHDEPERVQWLVETIQSAVSTPLCIDSPRATAIEAGCKYNKNGKPIINSLTDEKERYDEILPIVLKYNTGIVALCMDDNGMPEDAEGRIRIGERLINKLAKEGVKHEDIYIDPLVRPIGTGSHYGLAAIETIRTIKKNFPEVHIACGLSNVSFGLPNRKLINQTFLVAAIAAGMDGAILDPLDKKIMAFVYASEALTGADDFCVTYLEKFREGLLD
ncbi:MAG: methyltetrahydrofolate cobalamin methyltransferase [Spirochaetes bacterium]|nr:methyltetrahydrofolate cobalamin methyltransferase [Spirochaetota bacterium]